MNKNHRWIKLYLEILDDPKMGKLPDWCWRRAIELFSWWQRGTLTADRLRMD
jgi:hypothetical protein